MWHYIQVYIQAYSVWHYICYLPCHIRFNIPWCHVWFLHLGRCLWHIYIYIYQDVISNSTFMWYHSCFYTRNNCTHHYINFSMNVITISNPNNAGFACKRIINNKNLLKNYFFLLATPFRNSACSYFCLKTWTHFFPLSMWI